MTRFPLLSATAALALLCLLPACTGAAPPADPAAPAIDSAAAPEDQPLTMPGWADLLGPVSAPENWQVEPCRNPALLCVRSEGEILGTVERFGYPLSEVNVQGGAPTTPEAQRQFLNIWVADIYRAIARDRAGADPNLQFAAETPAPARVGSLPGLRYGYTITHPNGVVYDRTVGYVATDGAQVYVFVTGVISGDPSGSFGSTEDFAAFEPHLAPIIEGLRL